MNNYENDIRHDKLVERNVAGTKPRAFRERFDEYTKAVKTLTARTYREYQRLNRLLCFQRQKLC
jgi:hypothetical protein